MGKNQNVKSVWIDTNIIIYYLRRNKDFTPKVIALADDARNGTIELKVSPLIISECVFVLMGKQFRAKKEMIKLALISFINIPGVVAEEQYVIEEALHHFSRKGIDFTDAYLAAHARSIKPAHIMTKDFKGLNVLVEVLPEMEKQ